MNTLKIDMIYCKIPMRGKKYGKYKCRRVIKKARKMKILVVSKNEYHKQKFKSSNKGEDKINIL